MSSLPVVSWQDVERVAHKEGFKFDRQRGSHRIWKRVRPPGRLTIPQHREIAPGTLRSLIRDMGLSIQRFNELLEDP